MSTEESEGQLRTAGVAGLVMVIGIIVLGPVLGGPDALSGSAVSDYAKDLSGSSFLRAAPARFGCYALLTAVELVFSVASGRSLGSSLPGHCLRRSSG